MKMSFSRRAIGFSLAGVVILVVIVMTVTKGGITRDPYEGLTTQVDAGLSDSERAYVEQNLATQLAALDAQKKTGDVDLDLYLDIAFSQYTLGNLVGAREIYEEYFQLNPINEVVWNNYGNILRSMGDVPAAEAAYRQAISLYPNEEYYRNLVKLIQANDPEGVRVEERRALLEDGVDKIGQTVWFMVTLAEWYRDAGECDAAANHYEVAMSIDPENTSIVDDYRALKASCK